MSEPVSIVRSESPEERELVRKRAELAALEAVLAEEELRLTTERVEVFLFERRHMRQLAAKYAELDDLEADLAEALARMNPTVETAQHRAEAARKRANETARATQDAEAAGDPFGPIQFKPTEDLKQLFRLGAKHIHPDHAQRDATDEERQQRTTAMAAFNVAFTQGNELAMRLILEQWEVRPESVVGEDIAAQLVRVIRQIAQVERHLDRIRRETEELQSSPMFKLRERALRAEEGGRDLLNELATELSEKIAGLRESLIVLETSARRQ